MIIHTWSFGRPSSKRSRRFVGASSKQSTSRLSSSSVTLENIGSIRRTVDSITFVIDMAGNCNLKQAFDPVRRLLRFLGRLRNYRLLKGNWCGGYRYDRTAHQSRRFAGTGSKQELAGGLSVRRRVVAHSERALQDLTARQTSSTGH